MVMKPEPICRAVEMVLNQAPGWRFEPASFEPASEEPSDQPPAGLEPILPPDVPIILLTPQGRTFTQKVAEELAGHKRIALICGRYEGVDERVRTHLVTDEISIGDFVISGGELAAAIVVDAVTRPSSRAHSVARWARSRTRSPLGCWSIHNTPGLPPFGAKASRDPGFWRSCEGGAARRREQALLRTWQRRPDLLDSAPLSAAERAFLARLEAEEARGPSGTGSRRR